MRFTPGFTLDRHTLKPKQSQSWFWFIPIILALEKLKQ